MTVGSRSSGERGGPVDGHRPGRTGATTRPAGPAGWLRDLAGGIPRNRLLYLAALSFAAYANTWTLFFVVPRVHARYGFGANESLLLFVISIGSLLIATYPVGWLSDRRGRRAPFVYASLVLIGLTTIASAYAADYRVAVGVAVLSGLGAGGIASAFFALLCEVTEYRYRARVAGLVDAVSLLPALLIYSIAPLLDPVPTLAALGCVPLIGLLVCRRLEGAALRDLPGSPGAALLPTGGNGSTAARLATRDAPGSARPGGGSTANQAGQRPATPRQRRLPGGVWAGCPVLLLVGMLGWGLQGHLGDAGFEAGFSALDLYAPAWTLRTVLYLVCFVVGGALADRWGRLPVWTGGFLLRAAAALLFATLAPPLLWLGVLATGLGHINDGLGMMLFGEYAPRAWRARAFAAAYVVYLAGSILALAASKRIEPGPASALGALAALLAALAVLPLWRSEVARGEPAVADPPLLPRVEDPSRADVAASGP